METDPVVLEVIQMHTNSIGELRDRIKRLEARLADLEESTRVKATNVTVAAKKPQNPQTSVSKKPTAT
jgi:hypothetical protein